MTADPPTPDLHHDPDAHRFSLRLDGHEAELLYSLRGGRMVIDHTGVPEAIGGRGIAATMVKAGVFLRDYVYTFISMLTPELDADRIRELVEHKRE